MQRHLGSLVGLHISNRRHNEVRYACLQFGEGMVVLTSFTVPAAMQRALIAGHHIIPVDEGAAL